MDELNSRILPLSQLQGVRRRPGQSQLTMSNHSLTCSLKASPSSSTFRRTSRTRNTFPRYRDCQQCPFGEQPSGSPRHTMLSPFDARRSKGILISPSAIGLSRETAEDLLFKLLKAPLNSSFAFFAQISARKKTTFEVQLTIGQHTISYSPTHKGKFGAQCCDVDIGDLSAVRTSRLQADIAFRAQTTR